MSVFPSSSETRVDKAGRLPGNIMPTANLAHDAVLLRSRQNGQDLSGEAPLFARGFLRSFSTTPRGFLVE